MGRIVGSLFDDSGGSLVVTDLDVDSGTISVDETNNRVGLGTTAPGTQLQVESNAPYVTLKNDTSENTAGGCESKVIFEDHGNNALGQIEVSHVGSSDDEKGQLILKTNNDSGLQTALTISEAQVATFAGAVTSSGVVTATGFTIGSAAITEAELEILDGATVTTTELNLLDALDRGSILYGNSSGVTAVLGQGSADQVLTSDGTDISWEDASGGGGSASNTEDLILHMQVFSR